MYQDHDYRDLNQYSILYMIKREDNNAEKPHL